MNSTLADMQELTQPQRHGMTIGQARQRVQIDQIVNASGGQQSLRQIMFELHIVDDLALRGSDGCHQHRFAQQLSIACAVGHLATPD